MSYYNRNNSYRYPGGQSTALRRYDGGYGGYGGGPYESTPYSNNSSYFGRYNNRGANSNYYDPYYNDGPYGAPEPMYYEDRYDELKNQVL